MWHDIGDLETATFCQQIASHTQHWTEDLIAARVSKNVPKISTLY